jgi:hypothetical protein
MKLADYKIYKLITPLLLGALIAACTSNPFFKEDKIKPEQISGQILLDSTDTPDNIYVWLAIFNINTLTDSEGRFTLSLPAPETIGLGSNFSGNVDLYFYVANYYIDSTTIIFSNGKLLDDQTAVDNDGELGAPITLSKIASIVTFADQSLTNPNQLKIFVTLTALDRDFKIYTLQKQLAKVYYRTGLIVESLDNPDPIRILVNLTQSKLMSEVLPVGEPQQWVYELTLDTLDLPTGDYRAVLYLLLPQAGVPDGLLSSISGEVEKFGEDYLLLPMKREGGEFEIR